MKNKWIEFILGVALALCLGACGGQHDPEEPEQPDPEVTDTFAKGVDVSWVT